MATNTSMGEHPLTLTQIPPWGNILALTLTLTEIPPWGNILEGGTRSRSAKKPDSAPPPRIACRVTDSNPNPNWTSQDGMLR